MIGAGRLKQALLDSEDSLKMNTSFVERLNLTIRQGSAYLGRRALCSMKGHVKNKLQPRRLAKDSFMDSLPLLRRELPLSQVAPSFSLSALRTAAVVPWGVSVTSASDSCRWWSYLELCRCFGSLG